MEIRRLGQKIGAEITGVDVKRLTDEEFRAIYDAWLAYNVIAVRDQSLEIPDYLAYSRRLGSIHPHPSKSTRHPEYPEITLLGINKFRSDGQYLQHVDEYACLCIVDREMHSTNLWAFRSSLSTRGIVPLLATRAPIYFLPQVMGCCIGDLAVCLDDLTRVFRP